MIVETKLIVACVGSRKIAPMASSELVIHILNVIEVIAHIGCRYEHSIAIPANLTNLYSMNARAFFEGQDIVVCLTRRCRKIGIELIFGTAIVSV